jgi:hypothetical protein
VENQGCDLNLRAHTFFKTVCHVARRRELQRRLSPAACTMHTGKMYINKADGAEEERAALGSVCIFVASILRGRFAFERVLTKRRARFIAARFYKYRFVHARKHPASMHGFSALEHHQQRVI